MNDENQEVPLYNEIFKYLKHGEYIGWMLVMLSKSEKRAIRRRAHSFVMKGRLALSQKQYGRHDRKAMDDLILPRWEAR